jgi:uncharacterized protein YebE (UPF0316 family)
MIIFLVGILEMVIVTVWTKVVTRTQVLASGLVTVVNILIWYYVLETVLNNIDRFSVILEYAFGCAIGAMIGTYYFSRDEKATEAKRRRINKATQAADNSLRTEETYVS